jgi:excisionase family DNA binding protein
MPELMSTREVAEYLRIKERKVYDLVREKRIPCTRVTGKWLFPRHLIDLWVAESTDVPFVTAATPVAPPVAAGSHDPLFDWALRESGCALAMLAGGSLDGLRRLVAGEAVLCGLHVFDAESFDGDGGAGDDAYNVSIVRDICRGMDVVLVEWAWRQQGLVLAPGNPLGVDSLSDLAARKVRVVTRQHEAGSQLLFVHLLSEAGIKLADLDIPGQPALSETDLGLAVLEGRADAGLAVASVAHQFRLDFLPLHRERYDILVRRRDYFEAPFQTLLGFCRGEAFQARAGEMTGYGVSGLGRIVYNAP